MTELELHIEFIKAVESTIPCLTDWARTTGFGEVHGRDVVALRNCLKALDAHKAYCAEFGVVSPGSTAWPDAIRIARYHP